MFLIHLSTEEIMEKLKKVAEQNGIDIDYFPMKVLKGLSLPGAIALNPKLIDTQQEECKILAHELGHQMRYAFYRFSDSDTKKEWMERIADAWAAGFMTGCGN